MEKKIGDRPADMYLGGYGNFDSLAYGCCKKYQKTHPNVSLVFVTPYLTETYKKNHLEYEKNKYDLILYPEIEEKPLRYAIIYRNRWMVQKADIVVCGIDHGWGGAYRAYQYAKKKEKTLFNVTGKNIR